MGRDRPCGEGQATWGGTGHVGRDRPCGEGQAMWGGTDSLVYTVCTYVTDVSKNTIKAFQMGQTSLIS